MENQHRKIKGYRELTQAEIDLMNQIKGAGAVLKTLIDQVDETIPAALDDYPTELYEQYKQALRWKAIATTHLQQGLMALTRAVAKPDFF